MAIAILGTGNMGGAIARGLIKSGIYRPEEITCTAKSEHTIKKIREYNAQIRIGRSNAEAATEADLIILAVKPWLIGEVIEEIRHSIKQQIIVSVAANITLDNLAQMLAPQHNSKDTAPLFRAIPNTAVEALCGVTLIAQQGASHEQTAQVKALFDALGYALIVEEQQIPAGTSLASCGIAFAMRYIRAAMEGGVELGFRPEEAAHIVAHTVKGAATLLLENDTHPEAEIDKVTTAGGITIKGLNAMERSGFTTAVIEGLKASNV